MLCRTTPEQEKAVLDGLDASPENRREMDSLDETFNAMVLHAPVAAARPLKKTLELKTRENRIFEHDSTFFTFRLNNRFSESCFYR